MSADTARRLFPEQDALGRRIRLPVLREIGVRMAVGADARRIRLMVLREGMVLALLGGVAGLMISYGAARLLTSLLYGVAPTDPLSFAVVAAVVAATGLTAATSRRRGLHVWIR